jgi:hypothetical protein
MAFLPLSIVEAMTGRIQFIATAGRHRDDAADRRRAQARERKRRHDQRKRDMRVNADEPVTLRVTLPSRRAAVHYLERRAVGVANNAELAKALEPILAYILGRPK